MVAAKILLVEDDRVQAKVTMEYLQKRGHDVVWAENGKSAIKIAKTQPIDLVLLDRVLPDIDGNAVCRFLRLDENTKGVPIIFLTVKGAIEERVTGLEAGADDYLPKPYDEVELNARIYACLRTKALQDELKQMNLQLKKALAKVEVLARTDSLTGLCNRRHFEEIIENEFAKTKRYQTNASCLMIDVDHFKRINDEYSHQTGDQVLREIAGIIRSSIRDVDVAARWGGEEFIVLLPQIKGAGAMVPATRILNSVSEHKFSDCSRQITVSIGISSAPDPSIDTVDRFIHTADLALYEAKDEGRNRIIVAPQSLMAVHPRG